MNWEAIGAVGEIIGAVAEYVDGLLTREAIETLDMYKRTDLTSESQVETKQ